MANCNSEEFGNNAKILQKLITDKESIINQSRTLINELLIKSFDAIKYIKEREKITTSIKELDEINF